MTRLGGECACRGASDRRLMGPQRRPRICRTASIKQPSRNLGFVSYRLTLMAEFDASVSDRMQRPSEPHESRRTPSILTSVKSDSAGQFSFAHLPHMSITLHKISIQTLQKWKRSERLRRKEIIATPAYTYIAIKSLVIYPQLRRPTWGIPSPVFWWTLAYPCRVTWQSFCGDS